MKYVGSKNRHAKDLIPYLLNKRSSNQFYVEPFVGGFNMIDKISGNRIANDLNFYLIELFKSVQNGWIPPDYISEEEYYHIRDNKELYSPELVGFVGFGCSYSGKWFGGYARGKNAKGFERNYCLESKKNILKQVPKIQGVMIYNKPYYDFPIPKNSIIYCDPPYQNTVKYSDSISHDEFWFWCREKYKQGHKVYVSEYTAPEDFQCLWTKKVNNTLDRDTGAKSGVECLFTYNGGVKNVLG